MQNARSGVVLRAPNAVMYMARSRVELKEFARFRAPLKHRRRFACVPGRSNRNLRSVSMGSMSSGMWSRTSDVKYARVDESDVAYRVIVGDGSGPHDVVFLLGGTASMEAMFEDPVGVRFLDGLAGLGRLMVFDRRGIGLSDPPADVDLPYEARWSDD